MKKLYRSNSDKVVAGVLAGFAEYFDIDTTVIRLGYVLFTILTLFAGILFYIICWIVIPKTTSLDSEKLKDKESIEKEIETEEKDIKKDIPDESNEKKEK